MIPDWQLPAGVDRGLHDYLNSGEMVAGYDAMMSASALAAADVAYCKRWLGPPGRVVDLGCGTGRLARALVPDGWEYVGVDLSEEMLKAAAGFCSRESQTSASRSDALVCDSRLQFVRANLVELPPSLPTADAAACLFSTLGMVGGEANRAAVLKNAFGLLRLGGRFVLHAHNRHFRGLGFKGWTNGDITSKQAYGGAPLTIHHFTRGEVLKLLAAAGFRVLNVTPVGVSGELSKPWLLPRLRAYGWLVAAERPEPIPASRVA